MHTYIMNCEIAKMKQNQNQNQQNKSRHHVFSDILYRVYERTCVCALPCCACTLVGAHEHEHTSEREQLEGAMWQCYASAPPAAATASCTSSP